jgi:hypothetical protein
LWSSNSFSFNFYGKKIQLNPILSRPNDRSKKKVAMEEKGLNIISPREFERDANEESFIFVVVNKEIFKDS